MLFKIDSDVYNISKRIKDIDTGYVFPSPTELTEFLIDKLEPVENIEEKYYLSEYVVESYYRKNEYNEQNGIGFRFSPIDRSEARIAKTITTKERQYYDLYKKKRRKFSRIRSTQNYQCYQRCIP